ncbi:MAG: hypothetical protein A3K19_29960 [Lentisphaerae bacterium RIFOXYB12_FULL_65_16]|nr:MAG: hypothetical protein A3K18_33570 [Lentisphaerae bacterium RIFOXYA12_64_32]OGV86550.1 MAG: hypothetical protein A3K19_29960 [Lentisphaerae bacterium RIFOXYB12_FULL_65_16]
MSSRLRTLQGAADVRLVRLGTAGRRYDLLLAGQAFVYELTLVTPNTAEFSRGQGLRLADWRPSFDV